MGRRFLPAVAIWSASILLVSPASKGKDRCLSLNFTGWLWSLRVKTLLGQGAHDDISVLWLAPLSNLASIIGQSLDGHVTLTEHVSNDDL